MSKSQQYKPEPLASIQHPEWSKHSSIYQINIRQFTKEGTFTAALEHLPRLKRLGVDILWLMPIHPIGKKNRKGSLGSPYAVKDYFGVNPEFGSEEEFHLFIREAHAAGFKVILDWVANHTAWDADLVDEHPEWYARDWKGGFMPTAWWDWDDIIELDYERPELREYMTRAMKYWVSEFDIDGYRCDVAGFVPTDFWDRVRTELDQIKPVFLLAEWEARDLHYRAFDMTYGWHWNETMHHIAMGKTDVESLFIYYSWNEKAFPASAMRMLFVSNHDKNAWEGTEYEQFGEALEATIALSVLSEGMPLIYNGQEAGNERRLSFFEKDPIQWKEDRMFSFYAQLLQLKKENPALWNAPWGARMIQVVNSEPRSVFSFVRKKDRNRICAMFNFSGQEKQFQILDGPVQGAYRSWQGGGPITLDLGQERVLKPWAFEIWVENT